MRLLQLLVLACSLAELTWPENPKRTQLFRPSLAGRRRWCTAALLSSQSTAECAVLCSMSLLQGFLHLMAGSILKRGPWPLYLKAPLE